MSVSPAHDASSAYVLDPVYGALAPSPNADTRQDAVPWIYGNGQLEAWRIGQLVSAGFAAARHVHYQRNYGKVSVRNLFRHLWPEGIEPGETLVIRTNGKSGNGEAEVQVINLPPLRSSYLEIALLTTEEPIGMLVEEGPFRTGEGWEWSSDGATWFPATPFFQVRSAVMPHRSEEPRRLLSPVRCEDGIYDFGITLLARPLFRCEGIPTIVTGESIPESQATDAELEANHDLEQLPYGRWRSRHLLGFRYLVVKSDAVSEITAEASFHPVQYRGAFACSDELLTRVWMNSAFTLRTCMHQLMLDGVKRDRMPWVGDQASNLIVNAYTFAEADIIKQSLTALGRPVEGYINGIVDYSLWWVINQRQYQRYFDDLSYLLRELPHAEALLTGLANQCDDDGLLRPNGWIFIDWGLEIDNSRTFTALQILWHWAQRSGAELAAKCGNSKMADRWGQRANTLGKYLLENGWSPKTEAWREYLESEANSPYPNFLALLSGLATEEQYPGILKNLREHPAQGTPFMNGFVLMALSRLGDNESALKRMREHWGGMLQQGATTFWEDFKLGEYDPYAMYRRPFGKSLCHAWSSGPAAILPGEILGIRPLCDGWREFAVEPKLGELEWGLATVPTPKGEIEVSANKAGISVKIPAGLTFVQGDRRWTGPAQVQTGREGENPCASR